MPLFGSNRLVMTELRVALDRAPLEFISQAAVSVNDAPAPTNFWYLVFSFTVIVWAPPGLLPAKEIGACCCRPRVTLRPPESFVVVNQMLTVSEAAAAGRGRNHSSAATRASTPAMARGGEAPRCVRTRTDISRPFS